MSSMLRPSAWADSVTQCAVLKAELRLVEGRLADTLAQVAGAVVLLTSGNPYDYAGGLKVLRQLAEGGG